MKTWLRAFSLMLVFILSCAPLSASAAEVALGVAQLPPGEYESISAGSDGQLYMLDTEGNVIWRINPATGAYEKFYATGQPADADMDASGKLWWSDLTNKLGYFNTAANPLTLSVWTLPDDAFENPTNTGPLLLLGGDVWLANWNQPNFGLFRFSPGANPNFCHYAVSGGSYATDLVVQGDKLWWLSWQSETVDSLLSLAPESGIDRQLVRYSLGVDIGTAAGMAVDGNYLWWAEDKLNGAVARFDTTTGKLKRYPLPAGAQPVNVVVAGGAVWYADVSGAVGRIDPLAAAAMETTPTASAPLTVTPECQQLTDPTPRNEMLEPGILTWSDSSTTSSVPAAGLEVVAMPSGAEPVRIAAAAEKLWIINATGDQLLRMDLRNEQKIFLPMLTR